MTEDKGTKAIDRACEILNLLKAHPDGLMLTDIASALEFSKPTVHRILQALTRYELVRETSSIEGHYSLGLGTLAYSRAFLEGFDLVKEARPWLQNLNRETEETVHLGVLDSTRHWVVYLEKLDSKHAVRMVSRVGQVAPIHCVSLAKAILSYFPQPILAEILADHDFKRFTENTIVSAERFLEEVAITRERGYSLDMQEHEPGVICVGSAIVNRSGKPLAAVSISAPAPRLQGENFDRAIQSVCNTAKSISDLLVNVPSTEIG